MRTWVSAHRERAPPPFASYSPHNTKIRRPLRLATKTGSCPDRPAGRPPGAGVVRRSRPLHHQSLVFSPSGPSTASGSKSWRVALLSELNSSSGFNSCVMPSPILTSCKSLTIERALWARNIDGKVPWSKSEYWKTVTRNLRCPYNRLMYCSRHSTSKEEKKLTTAFHLPFQPPRDIDTVDLITETCSDTVQNNSG